MLYNIICYWVKSILNTQEEVIKNYLLSYTYICSLHRHWDDPDVSLALPCHDTSTGMQRDLPAPFIRWGPDLRLNFLIGFRGSECFDASRREEYPVSYFLLPFLVKKLFGKIFTLLKSSIFIRFFFACSGNVKTYPKIVKSGMVGFQTFKTFFASLFRSSIAIRWHMTWGVPSSPGAV